MVSNLNLLESRRRILLNTPHIETVSDTIASFKTDIATKLKGCKIHFTPIQEGEGDPSPDNVRPIHGWDGVTVTRCGKNLFANQKGSTSYIGLKAGVTYTISYRADTDAYFRGINENGSYITKIIWINTGVINERRYGRITPSIDIPYGFIFRNAGLSEAQIEVGSEATSYEPYESTTLTIPFPQTIYGGYVDLIRGEIVEDYIAMNENGWSQFRQNNGYIAYQEKPQKYITTDKSWYSNIIGNYGSFTSTNMNRNIIQKQTDGGNICLALDENVDITMLQLIVPITTPNTYPIDPQTLKALRGMNNIWSDANGNIEVSFYTH